MPPHISKQDDERFLQLFPYIHPGLGKAGIKEEVYEPHVFQQSVTLTASMWDESESKGNMENWNFGIFGILREYSPLLVGIICGFGIVLLVMSTVILWRYCFLSATKKVCCKGRYGDVSVQIAKNSLPALRKDKPDNQNGFEDFHRKLGPPKTYSVLQRSATLGSMPWHYHATVEMETRFSSKPCSQVLPKSFKIPSNPGLDSAQIEPLSSQDSLYTSHLYLHKLKDSLEVTKNLSRSTPALEDLYAKVNFSKKRKNRMRKDEAAIIAMSKSHSGHNNHSLAVQLSGSAVVVYNERTAL